MKNFLSPEERNRLKSQHKIERNKRVCDRIKAVLLYDEGWTYEQIAYVLLLTHEAVRQHVFDYQNSEKLKPQSGGSCEILSNEQSKLLEKHLQEHTYLYVKDILTYVECTYNVSYTVSGMRCWLKRHGFSYKKPALVPGKANEELQRMWIGEYEKLKANMSSDEATCFMDDVHPTHNTQAAYGWIKKAERKGLCANSGRQRLNILGAIDLIARKVHVQENKTLDADSSLAFLKKIEEAYPTKNRIHVFCDNTSYYKNKAVADYLKQSKIQLHFLPPYSPNLNPIERLWKWMRERVMYNIYYQHFDNFRSAILGFLEYVSNLDRESVFGKEFASKIQDNFRPISAPN